MPPQTTLKASNPYPQHLATPSDLHSRRLSFGLNRDSSSWRKRRRKHIASVLNVRRGGDSSQDSTSTVNDTDDDERYSRQMYALGARAHKLVRSTTAILDGPLGGKCSLRDGDETDETATSDTPSGLLYELAKNLALSGVGRIVLVEGDGAIASHERHYFEGALDDLGAAYHRAAVAEISNNQGDETIEEGHTSSLEDGAILLSEYIQRLNPGVQVDIINREKLVLLLEGRGDESEESDEDDDEEEDRVSLGSNPVVVCVDRSLSSQMEMNDVCRSQESVRIPFISVETAGIHAKVFCDFGDDFVVVDEDGETPRSTLLEKVEAVEEQADGEALYQVTCVEGERHDVSRDDVIEFVGQHSDDRMVLGSPVFPRCQVVSVRTPTQFIVKEFKSTGDTGSTFDSLLAGEARSFARIKMPRQLSFTSLRNLLKQPSGDGPDSKRISNFWENDSLFTPVLDKSFDPERRRAVLSSMAALDAFVEKHLRLPRRPRRATKKPDTQKFYTMMETVSDYTADDCSDIVRQFAETCRAKFTPVQAVCGALGAQEVLKAATGLYNPVNQFLLYDCDEILQDSPTSDEENGPSLSSGQAYILGDEICTKLSTSRLFLVGAGAIGCELLKNLAAMGSGLTADAKDGCIVLTDMDTIEKSNLSRQLLFRDHDVGEFKSVAAKAAVMRFSADCHVESYTSRVGEEEDGPFNDEFWSSGCDVVLNALDNVEARLFVDSQCVAHGLGLLDAGTLGPKGNVQVVVPHESESYGSSADPPEPDIPVCTLKNFPYEVSHTIQWARDLFGGYFHRRPRQANDHVADMAKSDELSAFATSLIEKLGEDAALDMAKELSEDLGSIPFIVGTADTSDPEYVQAVKASSLKWAISQAHQLFFISMNELIDKHPVDSLDDDGAPFWSGTRRAPKPLRFIPLDSEEDEVSAQQVIINERLSQFVRSAARLRMEMFIPPGDGELSLIEPEEALKALEDDATEKYKKRKSKKILHNLSGGGDQDVVSLIMDELSGAKTGASFMPQFNLADFEKDDESNGHVAFVTAASNLRALCYSIPPADAMETRRIAGRIVPAMITTTGLVSALSCLELVKLLKGLPLTSHRNAFVNLALPFFAFTAPLPSEEISGMDGKTHTIWDRVVIKGSSKNPGHEMTLSRFLKKVQQSVKLGDGAEVSSISYGPYMVYANFLHSDDEELLSSSVLDTVKEAIISEVDDDFVESEERKSASQPEDSGVAVAKLEEKKYIDLSVTVEDLETGEEFELPPVRLMK